MNKQRIERRKRNEEIKQEKIKRKLENDANGINCDVEIQQEIEAHKATVEEPKQVTTGLNIIIALCSA